MSKKDELFAMFELMNDAEANLAIIAIMAYRKKRVRTKGVGRKVGLYDEYFATLSSGDIFSADDVIAFGVSTTRAYARISADLEADKIKVFRTGKVGRAQEPTLYEKI